MLELARTYRFCASHRYWRDEWSEDQNFAVFGRCALPNGHGHNYRFTLLIQGAPDEFTGMIVDLRLLDALVESEILARFDHRNINAEIAHFARVQPTTENIAAYIFQVLQARLPRGRLVAVTVQEDEFLSATCRGDATS